MRTRTDDRGFALLEGVLAMGLFVIVLLAVAALLASAARLDGADLAPQDEATQAVQNVRAELANYVTADASAMTEDLAPSSGGKGSWRLPGDSTEHALSPGRHNATEFLPKSFRVNFAPACLLYQVTPAGDDQPVKVEFRVRWRDTECIGHAK